MGQVDWGLATAKKLAQHGMNICIVHRNTRVQVRNIDKYFKGSGVNGALYGALIGNSLSDFLGAIVDFPLMLALNITFGCLLVIPIVWFFLLFKKQ